MIDPDGIHIQRSNLPSVIDIKDVPEFDIEIYNLDDDKDYETFIKDVESDVRRSYEYRRFIKYLRQNMGMNKCSFLKGVSNEETFDIKIEIHHYPFTLRDIVEIVIRKRMYYHESMKLRMVSKEVMELHYKVMIGLIPLSETVHELAHSGRLFIPVNKVFGRYNLFLDFYEPFCEPEQLETLRRIEKYTEEENDMYDSTILEYNQVNYNVHNENYMLPNIGNITDSMFNRLESIKENNYLLPIAPNLIETKKEVICPIEFDESLIKR